MTLVRVRAAGSDDAPIGFLPSRPLVDVANRYSHDPRLQTMDFLSPDGTYMAVGLDTLLSELPHDHFHEDTAGNRYLVMRVQRAEGNVGAGEGTAAVGTAGSGQQGVGAGTGAASATAAKLLPSLAALTLDDYTGSGTEGVAGRKYVTPRVQLVEKVLILTYTSGFCMLKAPPRSGKTSVLELCQSYIRHDRPNQVRDVLYFNCLYVGTDELFEEAFARRTKKAWQSVAGGSDDGTGKKYIVLIDEIQASFKSLQAGERRFEALWSTIKSIQQPHSTASVCIVAAAMYGDAPSGSSSSGSPISSPTDLSPELIISLYPNNNNALALVLSNQEFEELWENFLRHAPQGIMSDARIKDHLWTVTAGHVGMITYVLDWVLRDLKAMRSLPEPGCGDMIVWRIFRTGDIYAALSTGGVAGALRSFMSLTDTADANSWQVLNKLLVAYAQGYTEIEMQEFGDLAYTVCRLQAKGYLHVINNRVRFLTPLHCHYYLTYHLPKRSRPEPTLLPDSGSSFAHFLEMCISRIKHTTLLHSFSVGTNGKLLERAYQMEFYSAAVSVLPCNCTVSPDVGAVFGSRGFVDFWIAPFNWAIELVRDGSKMAEHEARFTVGPYAQMPFDQHAIIDFHSPGSNNLTPRLSVYSESYHVLFGARFRTATIFNGVDKTAVCLAD